MASINRPTKFMDKTYEGTAAARITAEQQLRRTVMSCMLWEDGFYEDGQLVADRIKELVAKVNPRVVAQVAIEARTKQKLRHVPLLLVREMARHSNMQPAYKILYRRLIADTLTAVIQRPDEITEFMALYWSEGKCPISNQVKKGLAAAFQKFDEYSLAKYNRDGAIKLRDVMFMVHPSPSKSLTYDTTSRDYDYVRRDNKCKDGTVQGIGFVKRHRLSVLTKLAEKTLQTPDTWEVALSAGADKKETFERLMLEEKLGGLAFLRNLRNMQQSGVSEELVENYAKVVKLDRVLPFRFIAAANAVPQWEPLIESMMLRSLFSQEKLPGKTVILVDHSGSMIGPKVSAKSDMDRFDAAAALAILIREIAENPVVIGFGTTAQVIPPRRGFALRDAIKNGPGGGTDTRRALELAEHIGYDRIIVITDEQSQTAIKAPVSEKAYFINVANAKNGIGYGQWTHLDGWSEAVIDYIRAVEGLEVEASATDN